MASHPSRGMFHFMKLSLLMMVFHVNAIYQVQSVVLETLDSRTAAESGNFELQGCGDPRVNGKYAEYSTYGGAPTYRRVGKDGKLEVDGTQIYKLGEDTWLITHPDLEGHMYVGVGETPATCEWTLGSVGTPPVPNGKAVAPLPPPVVKDKPKAEKAAPPPPPVVKAKPKAEKAKVEKPETKPDKVAPPPATAAPKHVLPAKEDEEDGSALHYLLLALLLLLCCLIICCCIPAGRKEDEVCFDIIVDLPSNIEAALGDERELQIGMVFAPDGIIVKDVNGDGPVGAWNNAHPDRLVEVGDFITHAGGKPVGEHDKLLQYAENGRLKLRIQKGDDESRARALEAFEEGGSAEANAGPMTEGASNEKPASPVIKSPQLTPPPSPRVAARPTTVARPTTRKTLWDMTTEVFAKQEDTMTEKERRKLVRKEGGQIGSNIAGQSYMGNRQWYCATMTVCIGELKWLEEGLVSMNAEAPKKAKKHQQSPGGSGSFAKIILSANAEQVAMIAYVPKELQSTLSPNDWLQPVLEWYNGNAVDLPQPSDLLFAGVVEGDGPHLLKFITHRVHEVLLHKGVIDHIPDGDDVHDGNEDDDLAFIVHSSRTDIRKKRATLRQSIFAPIPGSTPVPGSTPRTLGR